MGHSDNGVITVVGSALAPESARRTATYRVYRVRRDSSSLFTLTR